MPSFSQNVSAPFPGLAATRTDRYLCLPVRHRYAEYHLTKDAPPWKINDKRAVFYLPNTHPEYDNRRILYYCDRKIWHDELWALQLDARRRHREEPAPHPDDIVPYTFSGF